MRKTKPRILLVVNQSEQRERQENVNIIEYDNKILQKIDRRYKSSYDYIIFSNGIKIENEFNNYILIPYTHNKQEKNVFMNILILNSILIENIENIVENGQIELAALVRYIQINEIKQSEFVFNSVIRKIKKLNNLDRKVIIKYKKVIIKVIREHYSQNSVVRRIKFYLKKNKIIKIFLYKILNNTKSEISDSIYDLIMNGRV